MNISSIMPKIQTSNQLLKVNMHLLRYMIVTLLSLIIVHLLSYGKLPLTDGYRFPARAFLIVLGSGYFLCTVNFVISNKIPLPVTKTVSKKILYEILLQFFTTIVSYSLIYVVIILYIFNNEFELVHFLKYLFISLSIIFFEYVLFKAIRSSNNDKGKENNKLLVTSGKRSLNISYEEIALFNSKNGVVSMILKSNDKFVTQFNSLDELLKILPKRHFFRVSRQFIVRRESIHEIVKDSNRKLIISLEKSISSGHDSHITISRYKSREFKEWMSS